MLKRMLKFAGLVLLAVAIVSGAAPARAQGISLIRDAEIENAIRIFAAPIFRAAKLNASSIKIHLVNDSALNAFVTGGQRVFINTGLITAAKSPGQIIGVIAHETGHIAGGHLVRIRNQINKSSTAAIVATVLGAVAIGAGRGDIGAAVIAAGQGIATRDFLKYTRTQEAAADQAGLKYLDQAGISSQGFLDFMKLLGEQELLVPGQQDPYVRTHPLNRNRVSNIDNHVAHSPHTGKRLPAKYDALFKRARAKLVGFYNSIGMTRRFYKESDNSLESRYARAIAQYRKPNLAKATELIDGLLAEHPNDPYFWELKGQMNFENGDAKKALPAYQKAVDLLPLNGLIRRDLARVQLAMNDPALLDAAILNLRHAISRERDSPFNWRQLAIAYGRKGDKGHSSLALAEAALLNHKASEARYHAGLVERLFPRGSREWIQAQDILLALPKKKP
ncbi:MAG: M48 family metalloprotease [Proteobacteria bacterium]|nr:M48 family metalloprotease [Pseudomonadota bacterium]MDA1022433.1 M48 family metalloprotease [Pseudomonadota bacterium]